MTGRAGQAFDRLCNAKHPVAGGAAAGKLGIASLAAARIQYNPMMRDQSARQAERGGATLCSVCSRIQLFIVLMIGGVTIALGEIARPPNALVYIISPKDGDTVTSPFRVQFGLSGMGVAPAGVETPNTGHHHLLIDANESLDPNEPIPQDKKHLHFGAGQTEALIELPPGKHTLQLVLGDRSHHLFHPPLMSDVITVNVN